VVINFHLSLHSLFKDANECWTQIVRILQQKLPGQEKAIDGDKEEEKTAAKDTRGFMDQYFGMLVRRSWGKDTRGFMDQYFGMLVRHSWGILVYWIINKFHILLSEGLLSFMFC